MIVYPDGSRAKVNPHKHKEMLRAGLLQADEGNRFRYTGAAFYCRSLADLRLFKLVISTTKFVGNYPGLFISIFRNKCSKEMLESPDRMAIRLKLLP